MRIRTTYTAYWLDEITDDYPPECFKERSLGGFETLEEALRFARAKDLDGEGRAVEMEERRDCAGTYWMPVDWYYCEGNR
jgi:hypothetical protein